VCLARNKNMFIAFKVPFHSRMAGLLIFFFMSSFYFCCTPFVKRAKCTKCNFHHFKIEHFRKYRKKKFNFMHFIRKQQSFKVEIQFLFPYRGIMQTMRLCLAECMCVCVCQANAFERFITR
jgi:hypothetical protein